jgi:DNA polymerase III epsilon subunit-like protein
MSALTKPLGYRGLVGRATPFAPYRIPRPASPAGLGVLPLSPTKLREWVPSLSLGWDGFAFLLWQHALSDIPKVEANWVSLAALFDVKAPTEPSDIIDAEQDAPCHQAWRATKHLQNHKSAAEGKKKESGVSLFESEIDEPEQPPIPEDSPLVFVDVEHTGGSHKEGARVVQIALTRLDQKTGFIDEFSSLVNPEGRESDYWAYQTHKISKWALTKAPLFSRMLPRVLELLNGAVFVAHNGRAVDEPFVKSELSRAGAEWPCLAAIDSLTVARKLFPHFTSRKGGGGHKLGALAAVFVVSQGTAHDAKGDVQTLMGVWDEIRKRHPKVTLTEMARY